MAASRFQRHVSVTPQRVFLAAAAASVLAILPILAAHHLPVLDAPGHEARLAVIRDLLISGRGSPFYASESFFLPNIAFDGVGLGLVLFVGPETAGRIFFGFTLMLTLWGILALNRAATGRWSFVPHVSALLLYNLISILGFFSYAFGLALVPWALAARLRLEGSPPVAGFLLGSAFGAILLFCHAFAFGVYAAMSAGFVLAALLGRRISFAGALARGFELVPAIGLFVAMSMGGEGEIRYQHNFFQAKLFGLAESLTSGCMTGDIALAAGLIAVILLAARSRVKLAPAFAPGLAALFALYLALPFELGSAANLDKRMPIAIALIALGCLDVHIRRDATSFVLVGLVVAALLMKQGTLAFLWQSFDPVIDAAVASIEALPAGSVVMQSECRPRASRILRVYGKWQPSMAHVAALATFDDTRFIASTWAIPGQQPITIKPPYRAYNSLQSAFKSSICETDGYRAQLASIRALAETEGAAATPVPPLYFFIIRPPAPQMLVSDADLVAAGRDFELYALRKP
jgi:hypothetical protein